MRGFACLVGLVLFGVACGDPSKFARDDSDEGGAGGKPSTAGRAGAHSVAGEAGELESESGGQAGAEDGAEAPAGGDAGSTGEAEPGTAGAGGQVEQGGAGSGGVPAGGSTSGGAGKGGAGHAGAPATNQCSGFTEYEIPAGTCLVATNDYQQQTDPECGAAGIRDRDHCATCATWTAVNKPSVVRLSTGAPIKRLDAPGGACPAGCKNICN